MRRRPREGTPIRKTPTSKALPLAARHPKPRGRCKRSRGRETTCATVVEIVRFAVVLFLLTETEVGMLHVTPAVVEAGVSAQARLTVPLNPLVAVTVTVELPGCPADAIVTGVPREHKTPASDA
jgi:hypothetical protein